MDRIKRALEKNKSRKLHILREQSVPVQKVQNVQKVRKIHQHDDIKYSRTRRIVVPQNILSENRIIAGHSADPRATYFRMLRTQV